MNSLLPPRMGRFFHDVQSRIQHAGADPGIGGGCSPLALYILPPASKPLPQGKQAALRQHSMQRTLPKTLRAKIVSISVRILVCILGPKGGAGCMILAQNKTKQHPRSPWKQRKNLGTVVVPRFFIWQRVKDSNPHIQSQSLLCYPYTNPLYLSAAVISRSEQILLYRILLFCQ